MIHSSEHVAAKILYCLHETILLNSWMAHLFPEGTCFFFVSFPPVLLPFPLFLLLLVCLESVGPMGPCCRSLEFLLHTIRCQVQEEEMRRPHEDLCTLAAISAVFVPFATAKFTLYVSVVNLRRCRSSLWQIVQDGVLTSYDCVTTSTHSQRCGSEAWNPSSRCMTGRILPL